jgi:hypothetical protein
MDEEIKVNDRHFYKHPNGRIEMAQQKICGPKGKHPGQKYWVVHSKTGNKLDYFRWDDSKLQAQYDAQFSLPATVPNSQGELKGHFTNHPFSNMTPKSITVSPPLPPVFSFEQELEIDHRIKKAVSHCTLEHLNNTNIASTHIETLYKEIKVLQNKLKRLDESSSEEFEMTQAQPDADIGWRKIKKRKMDSPVKVDQ